MLTFLCCVQCTALWMHVVLLFRRVEEVFYWGLEQSVESLPSFLLVNSKQEQKMSFTYESDYNHTFMLFEDFLKLFLNPVTLIEFEN